jgi:hypothetical protein
VAFPTAPEIAHPMVACSRLPSRGRLGYAQIVLLAQKKQPGGRSARDETLCLLGRHLWREAVRALITVSD